MRQQPSLQIGPAVLTLVACLLALFGLGTPGVAAQESSDQAAPTTIQAGDVDCGTDLGCLADQATTCTPSAVAYTLTLDFGFLMGLQSGLLSSTTDTLRLQPDPAGSDACQFNLRVQRVENRLLPEAAQALKERGASQADIDATQQNLSDSSKSLEGRSGTCLIAPDDLASMLQAWLAGNFSTDDFSAGSCQGPYFGD
jgi:hypothetical protein